LVLLDQKGLIINGRRRFVRVVGTIGDNLGQHELGGLCENFSTNQFPCRYCYTTMKNIRTGDIFCKDLRTPEQHAKDIEYLNEHEELTSYKGLKKDCCLNRLKSFHAFQPGMAPCVAHDIFEGILQYDLMLIIHDFSDLHVQIWRTSPNEKLKF
jgi:hypothetical protein